MKCPKCRSENPEDAKFCGKCGGKLALICSQCDAENTPGNNFCNECGNELKGPKETPPIDDSEHAPTFEEPLDDQALPTSTELEGERKHVTILFSDMSGYTAMSEKLDPEEVKEITTQIFGEISQIVNRYEGFIEKFIGDAVMAIFGATRAYEDDPVRAIKTAMEIHGLVESLSPKYEGRVGQPLSMHTGINTGLVVTGEVNLEKGTHGIGGDTINLAARLSSLGKEGDILVGPDTYTQAEGYFDFEILEPTKVKGKAKPIQVYRVLSQKDQPRKVHRLQGVRAKLIGRKVEMAQLKEAVDNLQKGNGSTFAVCGPAGTGKSRLIEEFKAILDPKEIQWREGHAYPYAQNVPYFPVINLLSRALRIEEGDAPEKIREKVENGIAYLVGEKENVVPYVGSLYSLNYPEIDNVSPEFWKSKLQEAIQSVLSGLAQRGPTIICLEDLHWADPSSLELIRLILSDFRGQILFLCIYRPVITLFTSHQISAMANPHQEIRLQDLSSSESQDMVESLLNSENIPTELQRFVQEKVEGNPFYLEEVANSLIESKTLIRDNGGWQVTRPITETDISSTIHGVISARVDRLEKETKRILQEASVIGRSFYYEILIKVSELRGNIDQYLSSLERLDLIKARSLEPDLEYMFKHALTQEVVYNSLLKKERREIHEQIALIVEQLFHERLPEFYETLAFHFSQGESVPKAVDYLMKSGEKSLKRYAVEEAHQYYKEAFDLLADKPKKTKEEEELLIDLIIKWAMVFYYRGDFKGLTDLLYAHEDLAKCLDDKGRLGMFYAWLGFSIFNRGKIKESHDYLSMALTFCEDIEDQQIKGYVYAWLTWTCTFLGLLDEAIMYGEKAQEIYRSFHSDPYLFFKPLGGVASAYLWKGEKKKVFEAGKALLEFGMRQSNIRSLVMGHGFTGASHALDGDLPGAIEYLQKAVQVSADPFYSQVARYYLGLYYISNSDFQDAKGALEEVADFSEKFGSEVIGLSAQVFLGVVMIAEGHMSQGLRTLEQGQKVFLENGEICIYAQCQYVMGKVYLQIVEGTGPKSLSTIARNIGFIMKNVPSAGKKAEDHFNKAIEVAKEIGAKGILGQAYLDLGTLHKIKRRTDKARECISEAVRIFEQCEAETFLKQAKKALEFLG